MDDLKDGYHIRRADGSYGVVEAVSATILNQPMFNLTVDTAHTFFVGEGQWLVHNDTCDLSEIADELAPIYQAHPPSSKKCNYCADQALPIISEAGFDAKIVGLTDEFKGEYLFIKSPENPEKFVEIADTGYHEVIEITVDGDLFYIDSVVYQSYGVKAIDWNSYHDLFAYAETGHYLVRGPRR